MGENSDNSRNCMMLKTHAITKFWGCAQHTDTLNI